MTLRKRIRNAFTLVELLVVIAIIAIGASILVPAYGRISSSLNYTGAVNSVVATIGSARTLAVRENRYTAVAFLWDEEAQRMSLQVLVQQPGLGVTLTEPPRFTGTSPADNYAMPYRPAPGQSPVELPPGALVYGLSYAASDTNESIDSDTEAWYAGHYVEDGSDRVPLWLFPRNDASWATEAIGTSPRFREVGVEPWSDLAAGANRRLGDADFTRAVRNAQTFCVQFAPDGSVVTAPEVGGVATVNAVIELTDAPIDRADRTAGGYDNDRLFDPEEALNATDPEANREVLMRSASQLAVVELARLREFAALSKPWHVQPALATTPQPQWAVRQRYYTDEIAETVSNWIDVNAEVLSFNRYSGEVLRRTQR
ncbi:MAG: prepilin-type N-terminal cleavage/methylation domain-containing protein [Planctomycetota bacterium]